MRARGAAAAAPRSAAPRRATLGVAVETYAHWFAGGTAVTSAATTPACGRAARAGAAGIMVISIGHARGHQRAGPALLSVLCVHLLLPALRGPASVVAARDFTVTPDNTCGGSGPGGCNVGSGAGDLRYDYMGDVSLAECELKCKAITCPCFDYSPAGTPAREGEHCRVCKHGSTHLPLRVSHWGYQVYVPRPARTSWLSLLVIAAAGGAVVYLGAGWVLNTHRAGKRLRGVEALPHARHWIELHGLVCDGIQYCRSMGKGGGRRAGYAVVGDRRQQGDARGGAGREQKASTGSKHRKHKGKDAKHKKSGKSSQHKAQTEPSTSDLSAPLDAAAPAPAPPPEREWTPTRSAHISRGARETAGATVH